MCNARPQNTLMFCSVLFVACTSWQAPALADVTTETDTADGVRMTLNNNPFTRPVKTEHDTASAADDLEVTATQLLLTGTLVGAQSYANIGGEVFTIGDTVNDLTLVEVHDRYVVLAADQDRTKLWVNGDDQSD